MKRFNYKMYKTSYSKVMGTKSAYRYRKNPLAYRRKRRKYKLFTTRYSPKRKYYNFATSIKRTIFNFFFK